MTLPDATTAEPDLPPTLDFLRRLWQLNHALEQLSSRMEKTLGVTAQQRLMVRCIGHNPGMTASHLSTLLYLDPGTVSTSLNRLTEKGLLLKKRDPTDKRRTFLHLSAKGKRLDMPTDGTIEGVVARMLETAPADHLNGFRASLEQFTKLLEGELGR